MVNKLRDFGIVNVIMTVVLLILLSCVFLYKGLVGAVTWVLMKLVIGPVGVLILFVALILLVIKVIKKKKYTKVVVTVILAMIMSSPSLLLVNIIKSPYPATENRDDGITIESPFMEEVTVGWGGSTVEENEPHVVWPSERWAYDFVKEPYSVDGEALNDFGIYGIEIVSPVNGTVVGVFDEEEDIPANSEEFLSLEGNYVYIRVEETGTYLLMNHLLKDSVKVEVGDNVSVGDALGRVGNSGSTSEPHLHIHHQRQNPMRTMHLTFAEGLPLYFSDENGKSYTPVKGEKLIKID